MSKSHLPPCQAICDSNESGYQTPSYILCKVSTILDPTFSGDEP